MMHAVSVFKVGGGAINQEKTEEEASVVGLAGRMMYGVSRNSSSC